MDVQVTDAKAMVLGYITSYVTKWHDAFQNDALCSTEVTGFEAALRYLQEVQVCKPEMYMQLWSTKITWTPSRTQRFTQPRPSNVENCSAYVKYKTQDATRGQDNFLGYAKWKILREILNHTSMDRHQLA